MTLQYWFDNEGLLHGPNVFIRLIPESGNQGVQNNHICIAHTMVGYLQSTDTYFRRSDVTVESTVGIGGKYDPPELDGAIFQWMRIYERADANLDANSYACSFETSDGGGVRYKEPWSPKQAEAIAGFCAAWCVKYGRPAIIVERASSLLYGLGYHRQGVDPYRGPTDDRWSTVYGKECPGDTRINQFVNEIIPRIRELLEGSELTEEEIAKIVERIWLRGMKDDSGGGPWTMQSFIQRMHINVGNYLVPLFKSAISAAVIEIIEQNKNVDTEALITEFETRVERLIGEGVHYTLNLEPVSE